MADALPGSIGLSALGRYNQFVLRLTPDKFADTEALYASLLSGDVAENYRKHGLASERFGAAFPATMESCAPESQAVSLGKAERRRRISLLPVDRQSYQGAVECFVIPMSNHFDLILGEDWCETTNCETQCDM